MLIEAYLRLKEHPTFKARVRRTAFGNYRRIGRRGFPTSRVRWAPWEMELDALSGADADLLAHLATSATATCTPYVEFVGDDTRGVQRTYWAQRACLCHLSHDFDSRGLGPGAAAVWGVVFGAEQMGVEFGAWSPVELPPRAALPPAEYAPTPGLRAVPGVASRPLLKNDADPVHDLLGPGRLSHPQEWDETVALLRQEGVDVVFRNGVMAYGPQSAPGKPGRLIIDPEASIGALRHEAQHYADDKAQGFPGMQALLTPRTRWRMEYRAYMQEVSLTRELRAFPTGKQLVANARAEKEYINKHYGPVQ